MAYRSRAHRHPAYPPPPRAPHLGREKLLLLLLLLLLCCCYGPRGKPRAIAIGQERLCHTRTDAHMHLLGHPPQCSWCKHTSTSRVHTCLGGMAGEGRKNHQSKPVSLSYQRAGEIALLLLLLLLYGGRASKRMLEKDAFRCTC